MVSFVGIVAVISLGFTEKKVNDFFASCYCRTRGRRSLHKVAFTFHAFMFSFVNGPPTDVRARKEETPQKMRE